MKKWMDANPSSYVSEPINVDTHKEPLFKSIKDKRRAEYETAREKAGLLSVEQEISDKKLPTLNYVEKPKHQTFRDIKEDRKRENMEEFKKLANQKHKTDVERLIDREEQIFANGYKLEDRETFNKLKERRKHEMIEYNLNTFSNKSIGVHGHELPKFAEHEDMKEYWKLMEDYKENPNFVSQKELREAIKYWKQREDLYLDENKEFDPNMYKKSKHLLPRKGEEKLIIKVNTLNHFEGFDPNNPRPIDLENPKNQHIYRWTSLVAKFCPQKFGQGRFFDNLDKIENANESKKSALGEEEVLALAEKKLVSKKMGGWRRNEKSRFREN